MYIASVGTFSIGFPFKYNDTASSDLFYVAQKYSNLKEEISEYRDLDMDQYQQESLPKAQQIMKTEVVRSMKWRDKSNGWKSQFISLEQLISIILYTDYTDLCTHFSATFRKLNPFETIESIKRRHSKYYHLSKTLRSTVNTFGETRYHHKFKGPFYCGMSMVMTLTQFVMKLMAPTSTSVQLAVSTRFSGDAGIIIQFDNVGARYDNSKGLDVSWISRFSEEDER